MRGVVVGQGGGRSGVAGGQGGGWGSRGTRRWVG